MSDLPLRSPDPVRALRPDDLAAPRPIYVVWELTMKCDQPCAAGTYLLGIESDGTVKACPTLPTKEYAGGNVRELSIEAIWEGSELVRFARDRTTDELWGFCKTCYYADVCRAGCAWTTHVTLGRRGNNPFCYHRVTQLRRKGVRERLVPVERAPNLPYDHGRFEIVEEPWPDGGREAAPDPERSGASLP
jgi:radical SAM protein with 4Fe4S-binding SPASM domain